jgi:hypothetical protein
MSVQMTTGSHANGQEQSAADDVALQTIKRKRSFMEILDRYSERRTRSVCQASGLGHPQRDKRRGGERKRFELRRCERIDLFSTPPRDALASLALFFSPTCCWLMG